MPAPRCAVQVVVSLKRLEDDPLQETLDKVLPLNEASRGPTAGAGAHQPGAAPVAGAATLPQVD